MRLYAIKNLETGMYISRLRSKWDKKGNATWYVEWINDLPIEHYRDIEWVNDIIEEIIGRKIGPVLDRCEILTVKRVHVPIKSSVKMKTYRNRHEQKMLVRMLKG